MIQILGIIAITLISIYMMYLALFIPASLTFNGKIRLIDKFIGFFNKDYKEMCNEYIEARAETKQQI